MLEAASPRFMVTEKRHFIFLNIFIFVFSLFFYLCMFYLFYFGMCLLWFTYYLRYYVLLLILENKGMRAV